MKPWQQWAAKGKALLEGAVPSAATRLTRERLAALAPARQKLVRTLTQLTLGKRLPIHQGTIKIDGLAQPVTIRRDKFGVPYIDAKTEDDLWFGLGFCHGQDRAGQLEVTVRIVRGTLAAAIGPDGLAIDRLSRRIGFHRAAGPQVDAADPATQRQFAAYAKGLNAGVARGGKRLAHEFALLRCEPTLWTAVDVQALCVLLCFALASNWDIELARLKILQADGAEALAALDPEYPDWLPVSTPPDTSAGPAMDHLAADVRAFSEFVSLGGGSNAWVLAPSRTTSGRALLANDPHLNPAIPGQWYLSRLSTPEWSAVGASFVGVPAIASGHNGKAAWGVTAAHADNTDLFLEEIGSDGRSVRDGDNFLPCEVLREVIEVKGAEPVVEEVLITPRGPIISPAFAEEPAALSLSATWLWPRANKGLFGIHRVQSADEFRDVFSKNTVSAAGMVYADDTGTIAYLMAASLPKRKKGFGNLPMPGWDKDAGWHDEPIDAKELPFAVDPEQGFLCTANNKPVVDADGPFLGLDWLDGYRQQAITEALRARKDWRLQDCLRLQTSTQSMAWNDVRDAVLAVDSNDADTLAALTLLRAWDGDVAADSAAASVFEFFVSTMCKRIANHKAPRAAKWALGHGFVELLPQNMFAMRRMSHMVKLLREQPRDYFSSWNSEIALALKQTVITLRKNHGELADCLWGKVRPMVLHHPFGDKRPMGDLFNRGPYPGAGDSGTISQGAINMLSPDQNLLGLATLRTVIDVGDWDNSRFVLLGGQSGNPLSDQYDDQIALWQKGQGIAIPWSESEVEKRVRKTLTLEPQ